MTFFKSGEGRSEGVYPWVQAGAWREHHRCHSQECGFVNDPKTNHFVTTLFAVRWKELVSTPWSSRPPRAGPQRPLKARQHGHLVLWVWQVQFQFSSRRWDGVFGFRRFATKELGRRARQHDCWSQDKGHRWRCFNHWNHQETGGCAMSLDEFCTLILSSFMFRVLNTFDHSKHSGFCRSFN